MNFLKRIILILTCIYFINCGTISTSFYWNERNAPILYSGTRCDYYIATDSTLDNYDSIYIFDLPFSLILDTLILPLTIPYSMVMSSFHNQYQIAPGCYEE